MRIGIIGNGVVGSATAKSFEGHVDDVLVYDSNPLRSKCAQAEALACDLVFVCLPTPQKVGSLECDTSALDNFFMYCSDKEHTNLVLKSTVPVGYTRRMATRYMLKNLVHSPEFLTARTAEEDAKNPTRLVIGVPFSIPFDPTDYPEGTQCGRLLRDLYKRAFNCRESDVVSEQWSPLLFRMTSDESEFVKLMQNSFSAVKVAFFNEMRAFSDAREMDWQRCLDALLAGGWINPMHTQVPGPDGKRGFGGSCLPKDLANMLQCMEEAGCVGAVGMTALHRNKTIDRKE